MIFDRAGFALLDDLRTGAFSAELAQLERVEAEYAKAASLFHDDPDEWIVENLHNWSRAWEYSYVLHHIRRAIATVKTPVVADFGSGVTFFPFAVARLGAEVICLDSDPVVVHDLGRAVEHVGVGNGSVEARLSATELPLSTGSVDIAYSVSVLEHMPEPESVVGELARVVKPKGWLILTFDLDVDGDAGVPPERFEALRSALGASFSWHYPERVSHPQAILTSRNSPWPRPGERHVPGLLYRGKAGALRPLVGGPSPGVLTVYGCVLRRSA